MNETRHISGHDIELSHLDKVYFPESGITKGEVLDYYQKIAPHMLPHIKDRPLTMHRYPEGIEGQHFYQQDISDYYPDWIARVTVQKEGGTVTHVLCNDAATLLYVVNQGSLVLHSWLSHSDRPNYPDRLVMDLDPPEDIENLPALRSTALRMREAFEGLGLTTFVSTTGSTGYHIYVPIKPEKTYDEVREFAHGVVTQLTERYPDDVTVEQRKVKRGQRIFLDTLRNSYAHTAVAPYSVRARPGAPVATPLSWDELEAEPVAPRRYTIKNVFGRLSAGKDPWADMYRHASSLGAARERPARQKA